MVNFGSPAAEICWRVWGTAAYLAVDVSQALGVEQTAPPIFGRAAITLGIGRHSSYYKHLYSAGESGDSYVGY